jgi:hypothetical protein
MYLEHMTIQMTKCTYIAIKRRQENNLSIFIPSSSATSNNNQKTLFDASVDNNEWKNAKQFSFNSSNNIRLGKLYLQFNLHDNALEGAFVIPNSAGSSSNNDVILHLLFNTFFSHDKANNLVALNPDNDHRIDISKDLQHAGYLLVNDTEGWNVVNNSVRGNDNITM